MQTTDRIRPDQDQLTDTNDAGADISAEIRQLRDDLKALKDDFTSLTATAAQEAKSVFKDKLSSTEDKVHDAVEAGASEMQEIQRQAEIAVRKKPLTAMAAALAIGYFIAGVTRK